jgi:hypothetical protein
MRHYLTMELRDAPLLLDLKNLTAEIGSLPLSETLRTFGLFSRPASAELRSTTFDISTLSNLYTYRQLEIAQIEALKRSVKVSNHDIEAMAKAWCNLRILEIHQSRFPATIGLYALHALAKHCPHLGQLTLAVDSAVSAPFLHPNAPGTCRCAFGGGHGSRVLDLQESERGPNVDFIADFLDHTFPRLREFKVRSPGVSRGHESWEVVAVSLPYVEIADVWEV